LGGRDWKGALRAESHLQVERDRLSLRETRKGKSFAPRTKILTGIRSLALKGGKGGDFLRRRSRKKKKETDVATKAGE